MPEIKLDLDALAPKPYLVRLCGQTIEVHPPKFKHLVNLMNIAQEMTKSKNTVEAANKLLEGLYPIIPDLKKEGIDATIDQLLQLVQFVQDVASPDEPIKEDVAEVQVPDQEAQKKTE